MVLFFLERPRQVFGVDAHKEINIEDYLNSSDIEFEPGPSKASSKTPGLASITQIVADADDDRISSKRRVKQLEFGNGAPSTRLTQELWIGRFNAFRQFTLKQSLDKPFGGDDLVRFFDAILDKVRPHFTNKPAPSDTLVRNEFQILIKYTKTSGFEITRRDGVRM